MAALTYAANASTITYVGEFDGGNASPATILATANANNVDDYPGTSDNDLIKR
jgi:hypothetical protein